MHLRHRNYRSALAIMQHACTGNIRKRRARESKEEGPPLGLTNNVKSWSFYVDLLENVGTVENTKMAYERMLDMKIANP